MTTEPAPHPKVALSLRPVEFTDREFVFQLVNDPLVRAMSFHSEPIGWEDHCQWFQRVLDSQLPFYIAEVAEMPCGYARFAPERVSHTVSLHSHKLYSSPDMTISIAMAGTNRGYGIGTVLLVQACQRLFAETRTRRIHAWVKEENTSSHHMFHKAGFIASEKVFFSNCQAAHYQLFRFD